MERIGEVTAVRGNWLEITLCRPADCEKCNACRGGQKTTTVTLEGKACVGDLAAVEMPERVVVQASALAYALPLGCLMAGMFLGGLLFPQQADIAGGVGAVTGLAVSACVLAITEAQRRRSPRWKPRLSRIIPKQEGE